jgi:hypothetical protein
VIIDEAIRLVIDGKRGVKVQQAILHRQGKRQKNWPVWAKKRQRALTLTQWFFPSQTREKHWI